MAKTITCSIIGNSRTSSIHNFFLYLGLGKHDLVGFSVFCLLPKVLDGFKFQSELRQAYFLFNSFPSSKAFKMLLQGSPSTSVLSPEHDSSKLIFYKPKAT